MRPVITPLEPLRSAWRYRDLVWQMTERDARSRYRGSAGGLFWVAFHPLLMLAVYTFLFGLVFNARWPGASDLPDFVLMLYCGLITSGIASET